MTGKTPLPDRWDGTDYRDGCRVMPPAGPKIGMHWGQSLILEHHCREALQEIQRAYAELRASRGSEEDDGLDLDQAMQRLRIIEATLASVRHSTPPPSHICECGQIVLVDAVCSCGIDAIAQDNPNAPIEGPDNDDRPF